jgi:hypothetical protein
MICPECQGRGFVPIGNDDGDDETAVGPCLYCIGGAWPSCEAAYRDDSYPERTCEHCSMLYHGPAVYCSPECATEDL